MNRLMRQPARTPPLFAAAEIGALERERERLSAALERMRKERRHGAIQRTEFRLQDITRRILALAQNKEIAR